MHLFHATATVLAALCTATPALADLTVEQAWATWKAQVAAYGLTLDARESRDGKALQIGQMRLTFAFPMEMGSAYASFAGPRFEPLGDGRVAVTFPETGHLALGGEVRDEGSLAVVLETSVTGAQGLMSGTPGEVVSDWKYDSMTFRLLDVAVSGSEVPELSGLFRSGPATLQNVTRIDDSHVTIDGRSAFTSYDFSYEVAVPGSGDVAAMITASGLAEEMATDSVIKLPRGGIDLLGLHAQLRDGMHLETWVTAARTRSDQSTREGDALLMTQTAEMQDYDVTMKLGPAGLDYRGRTGQFSVGGETPDLPVPFTLSGSGVDFHLLVPLLMGEDQDVALRMGLYDLAMADGLWALFDPEGQLSRDPATLVIDLGATVSLLFEFLDVRAMIGGARPPELPVMAKTARLNDLRIAAAGAELTGEGDITLDYTDWETFDGMPAPDGRASFQLTGAHALLDKLIAMGLVSEEDAMGARLVLGMVSKPDGDTDSLRSEIEVRKTGEVVANGVRLK
ncbi:hypothetical protein [Marimonas arenosa]|uniref:DUF2125 domain-containing protein n=1 Tax=Marimonas arenosa TaxID=1795305 RepID=A0AAE3WBU4_9RHOB|nr:hypothetical protein [Marimonas arenosa]MDQ2089832.1 DUF2125 domain-containing protein [Marimonas arenosa]